ncbi:ABC transporter ATP-binding protein [Cellulosimicrobium cellulans]|uniref:ABC transporter ATP-binding protein n=1 Tax=Cellulosimicrobium cellulans TaxID=1710 RepID=UPI002404B40C|nr:energy-coupling factor transporter ATPase [Cellulosimicrobium cellulans]MDF9876924.1 energy-coupling factor transporter ATP-binding protein EcfA2 [Cellulosimicrobium cellulans]
MIADETSNGTPQPLLAVRGVSVRYHEHDPAGPGADPAPRVAGRPTPDDVTFDVRPGEAVLLLGPSGCGKSTLALATNGLVPHVVGADLEGAVRVLGRATAETPPPELSRDVAMVFQDPDAQVVTGTLLDEVCFGPENLRLPVDDVLARAEDALRRVGLWERRDDDPAVLSGGGRQRLAIACALALGSPLLVLDEPTANLDPQGTEEVYAVLRDVVARGDRAVLLVEHDLDAAVSLVDRVVVLDGAGRLAHDGPVRAVLGERAEELAALGVWLPTATLAALRLRAAGVHLDPVPLAPDELGAALAGVTHLPDASPRPREPGPAAPEPVLVVDRVTLRRGDRRGRGATTVLRDVSLAVAPGELVAVVGANGAGKTTLAQLAAGVLRPRRGTLDGRVTVTGIDPTRADPRELSRHVGFVFQNPEHQLVTSRVDDELALGLRVRGVPDDEVAARVEDVLRRFGLADLRDRHPFLLSGGQKRRLSVGTAIVCRPEVLVLDEPTYGQDRERAAELLDLLTDLHRDGTAVVVVSHDMQLVAEHATRVVALADGSVVADGAPGDVLADEDVLRRAGLRPPPLARATRDLADPAWRRVARLADLPVARVPAGVTA